MRTHDEYEDRAGFVSGFLSPPAIISRGRQLSPRCRRQKHVGAGFKQNRTVAAMRVPDDANDRRILETDLPDAPQPLDESDYIVDIADHDAELEDEDLDVVDVISDSDIASRRQKRIRKRIGRLVEEINLPPATTFTSDADRQPPIEEDETADLIRTVVKAADERKGKDIVARRISKLSYVASFIVIATGKSPPQIRAIANLVEEELGKKHSLSPRRIEGVANSGWILLDYGDFLVNIFSPEQRRNYNLEALWQNAEEMDISDCLAGQSDEPEAPAGDSSLDDWLKE